MGSNHPRLRSKPRGRGELDPSCREVYEPRPRLTSGREFFWATIRLEQYGRIVAHGGRSKAMNQAISLLIGAIVIIVLVYLLITLL
jgi:hypothetical protein